MSRTREEVLREFHVPAASKLLGSHMERYDAMADRIAALESEVERVTRERDNALYHSRAVEQQCTDWRLVAEKYEAQRNTARAVQYDLRQRAEAAERDAAGICNVLGFFASCIKGGEPWTDECDQMLRAAFAHRDTLTRATAHTTEEA